MEPTRIEIPLSKAKIIVMIATCLVFVCLGVFMILNPDGMQSRRFGPEWIISIGVIGILFFGAIGISIIKKMGEKRTGLVIDQDGIWDNSSGVSAGLIKWPDVLGIRKVQVYGTRFLLIDVRNPEDYIKNATGLLKKNAMKANKNRYGTPISISAGSLRIKFNALEHKLLEAYRENTRIN